MEKRLDQHNNPAHSLSLTTKRHSGPWLLVWSSEMQSRNEALRLERRIKKRGIGLFLQEIGC